MPEYLLPLIRRELVAEETMAFWFDRSGTDLQFEAGQNADYYLIDPPQTDAEGNKRTFSFASAPEEKDIMITTRMRNTAFKNWLRDMPLGTKVKVEAPLGNMVLHEDQSRPAVFIAGGIGITPFRSLIGHVVNQKLPYAMTLLYSNRTLPTSAFVPELRLWSANNPNFKMVMSLTDEQPAGWTGETVRLDAEMINRHVPDLQKPVWYVAGPPGMNVAVRSLLRDMGISRDNVRTESFSGY